MLYVGETSVNLKELLELYSFGNLKYSDRADNKDNIWTDDMIK